MLTRILAPFGGTSGTGTSKLRQAVIYMRYVATLYKIVIKRPGLPKKKPIFRQDNASAHKSVLAIGKLRDLHYELLEHPPYTPDSKYK